MCQGQVSSSGFGHESRSKGLMICLKEKMIYKMESRGLIMRFTIVPTCFDKLIHQLG
jgi:hypothetical protein